MKRKFMVWIVLLAMLCGCRESAPEGVEQGANADHEHLSPGASNIVPHDVQGYCGNTLTTVRSRADNWEFTFWGGNSVSLTDFLLWLDYKGEICRCLPEYYVRTEFGTSEYGINLTQGYVRYGQGQTMLTEKQLEYLRQLLDDVNTARMKDVEQYPGEEE